MEPDEAFVAAAQQTAFVFLFKFFEWPSLSLLHNQDFLIAQRDSSLVMPLFYKFMSPKFQFVS